MSAANVTVTINTTATRTPLIAGVDVSSRVLAVVLLNAHTGALHETLEMKVGGAKGGDPGMAQSSAFRIIADTCSWASTVYIENPMGGQVHAVALCNRALGALIHRLGDYPESEIVFFSPTGWKKAAGMKGNAGKPVIREHALALYPELAGPGFSQDICDAACIARAGFNVSVTRLVEGA